ncbi:MAG TPA: response regulator [Humisphaera sp.]
MRILLVEDHEDTRKAMSALLRITGHQVVDVGDGGAAVSAVSAHVDGFDCAVIDLGLPDQDGIALLGELRSRGVVRAIALTGSTAPDDVAACRAAGFTCHLSKPVTIEELNAALGKL